MSTVSTCGVGSLLSRRPCRWSLVRTAFDVLQNVCSYLIWEGIVWLTAQLASWGANAASTVSCCPAGVVLEVDVYGVVFSMVVM